MKRFFALIFIFIFLKGNAHTVVTFQPDSACGKDAVIGSLSPNSNSGAHPDFIACAWTNGGNPSTCRSLVSFDLATIPPGATIIQATLDLYHYASPNNTGHSNLSGPASCWLERIIQPWGENTVTWNNQPATSSVNQLNVPAPISMTQNYSINVISLVNDMIADPANSFGFELRQQNESYYRSLLFASSDMSNSAFHPKLTIIYDYDLAPLAGCWTNFVITPSTPSPTPAGPDPIVHFPNVFSPNGDGKNDYFFPDSCNVEIVEFTIHNRWGERVYTATGAFPWDGNYKGNPCSDGVYYYLFRYKGYGEEKSVSGFVTLIR